MWRDDRGWPTPKRTVRRELVEVDFLMPSTAWIRSKVRIPRDRMGRV